MQKLFGAILLMMLSVQTQAAPSKVQNGGLVEIFVASELANTPQWKQTICADLQSHVNSLQSHRFNVRCTQKTPDEVFKLSSVAVHDERIAATFTLIEDFTAEIRLTYNPTVTNPDLEFSVLSWRISMENASAGRTALRKLIQNAIAFHIDRDSMARHFLRSGSVYSKKIGVDQKSGSFIDKTTGQRIDWRAALKYFQMENDSQKQYLRTALELAAFLGGGAVWYYSHHEINAPDQQYSSKDISRRLTSFDTIRLDDNASGINRKHVYVGTGYYLVGRSNGLSGPESLLASFVTSSMWEYFIEYQEVVSINDSILTPYGGFVFGEVLFQMGRAFRSSKNPISRVIGQIIDPLTSFNRWIDSVGTGKRGRQETFMDSDAFRSLKFYVGSSTSQSTAYTGVANAIEYGVDLNVIDIPSMDSVGKTKMLRLPGGFNELLIKVTKSEKAPDEFKIFAKTSLFTAFHQKNLARDGNGDLTGYSVAWGPVSSMTLDTDENKDGTPREMEATVGLLGNSVNLSGYFKGFKLNLQLDVIGDFAMIRSYAIDGYKMNNDISGAPIHLQKEGYSYGFGSTTRSKISLNYAKIEAGVAVAHTKIDAMNLRSRYFETVTQPLAITERKAAGEIFAALNLNETWRMQCGFQKTYRSGTVEQFAPVGRSESRKYCVLSADLK